MNNALEGVHTRFGSYRGMILTFFNLKKLSYRITTNTSLCKYKIICNMRSSRTTYTMVFAFLIKLYIYSSFCFYTIISSIIIILYDLYKFHLTWLIFLFYADRSSLLNHRDDLPYRVHRVGWRMGLRPPTIIIIFFFNKIHTYSVGILK